MANLNLNVNPYFDDYEESKNYYKILFKPGVALQARELTQVQSILQNQISKIGAYLFKDGTSLSGTDSSTISINYEVRSIKLKQEYNGRPIDVSNFLGKWVVGRLSGIIGEVKFVYQQDFPDIGDPPTIVISLSQGKYTSTDNGFFQDDEILNFYSSRTDALNSGSATHNAIVNISSVSYFVSSITAYSDELTIVGSTSSIKVGDYIVYNNIPYDTVVTQIKNSNTVLLNRQIPFTIFNERIEFNRKSSTQSLILSVDSGTFYKNGTFIVNAPQSIVPSKYTAYPTVAVGFRFIQTIVNSDSDVSLLDPALGSSNYFAQGADRLKYELQLEKIDLINDNTSVTQKLNVSDTFIELIRFNQGKKDVIVNTIVKSSLRQELAKRTYDESGNYIVVPFNINLIPTSNNATQFKFDLMPGTAYIGGYEVTTISPTTIYLNRALDTDTDLGFNISSTYGNYVIVDGIQKGLISETIPGSNAILEAHSVISPTSSATRIGYLGFKHLEHDSGTQSNSAYRLYSYFFYPDTTNNIPIDHTNSFVLVNNTLNNLGAGVNYTAPLFKANVASIGKTSTGNIKIFENNVDRMIFSIPRKQIKSVSRVSTQYNLTFKDVLFTSGVATITVTSPLTFVGADGTLTNTEKRTYFTAVVKNSSGATSAGYFPLDTSNISIALTNQSRYATFTMTDTTFNGFMDIVATIDNDNTTIRTKTLANITGEKINITVSDSSYSLSKSDINNFYRISRIGSNVFSGVYSETTNYITNNIIVDSTNGNFYRALQNSYGEPLYDLTFWSPLDSESTLNYYLDNGQRDNMYDYGTIRWISEDTPPGNVVVSYNYYNHSGQGPLVADSYPSYDTIPKFISPLDFTEIELRDALDFRPRRIDNNKDRMVFAESIKPNPQFLTEADVTYYKPRYDRVYITNQETDAATKGQRFFVQYGIPDLNPVLPPDKTGKDIQLIYNVYVEPYTSNVYLNKFEKVDLDRYTMKNIGDMNKRLIDVERKVRRQGLEIQALNAKIADPNGVELFKTGIFIDDFKDRTKADVTNTNFKALIDTVNEECTPPQSGKIIPLSFRSLINMVQFDRLLMMEKSGDEVIMSSLNPTGTINANPGSISPGPIIIIKSGTTPGYIGNGVEPSLVTQDALALLRATWDNRSGLFRDAAAGSSTYPGDVLINNEPYQRLLRGAASTFTSYHSNPNLRRLSKYTTVITAFNGDGYGANQQFINGIPYSPIFASGTGQTSVIKPYGTIGFGMMRLYHFIGDPADITSITSSWISGGGNYGNWPYHYIIPGRWGVGNISYSDATNIPSEGQPDKNVLNIPLLKDRFRLSQNRNGSDGYNDALNEKNVSVTKRSTHWWYGSASECIAFNLTGVNLNNAQFYEPTGVGSYWVPGPFVAYDFVKLPEYANGGELPPPIPNLNEIYKAPPAENDGGGSTSF